MKLIFFGAIALIYLIWHEKMISGQKKNLPYFHQNEQAYDSCSVYGIGALIEWRHYDRYTQIIRTRVLPSVDIPSTNSCMINNNSKRRRMSIDKSNAITILVLFRLKFKDKSLLSMYLCGMSIHFVSSNLCLINRQTKLDDGLDVYALFDSLAFCQVSLVTIWLLLSSSLTINKLFWPAPFFLRMHRGKGGGAIAFFV